MKCIIEFIFFCYLLFPGTISAFQSNDDRNIAQSKCSQSLAKMENHEILLNLNKSLKSCTFFDVFDKISNTTEWSKLLSEYLQVTMTAKSCETCQLVSAITKHFITSTNISNSEMIHSSKTICLKRKFAPVVCEGLINLFGNEIIAAHRQTSLNPLQICSLLFGDVCPGVNNPQHEWKLKFRKRYKHFHKLPRNPKENGAKIKVLHLTDLHWDYQYREGTNAVCDLPLCCRNSSGMADSAEKAAGKWGDYRCDVPKATIEHLLDHIKHHHKDVDYMIWTGDLPAHDIWSANKQTNLMILDELNKLMRKHLPCMKIFPALGNHESVPNDNFPTEVSNRQPNISWLYDELAEQWSHFLPSHTMRTIRRGGFYSTLAKPDLRIIAINSNFCSNKNWWLVLNSEDPFGQLKWLIDELTFAEEHGEKVHILGHVPPGYGECVKVWSENFHNIVKRFSNTIKAQFYGHTHFDEFKVFYDSDSLNNPIGVSYIAPSVTTFTELNPAYRIYHVDGDHEATTRTVLDHETWILNLTEANKQENPKWQKSYSALEAYNMTSLSSDNWHRLINQMRSEKNLLQKYHKYYYSESPVRPTCDENCEKKLICDMQLPTPKTCLI